MVAKLGRPAGKENFGPDPISSLASRDGWVRLGAGMLRQAVEDAREGDPRAANWLLSDDCATICDVLGFDFEAVRRRAVEWSGHQKPGKLVIRLFQEIGT